MPFILISLLLSDREICDSTHFAHPAALDRHVGSGDRSHRRAGGRAGGGRGGWNRRDVSGMLEQMSPRNHEMSHQTPCYVRAGSSRQKTSSSSHNSSHGVGRGGGQGGRGGEISRETSATSLGALTKHQNGGTLSNTVKFTSWFGQLGRYNKRNCPERKDRACSL